MTSFTMLSVLLELVLLFVVMLFGESTFIKPQSQRNGPRGVHTWEAKHEPSTEDKANASKILWEQFLRRNEDPSISYDLSDDNRRKSPPSRKFPHIVDIEELQPSPFHTLPLVKNKKRRRKGRRKGKKNNKLPTYSVNFPHMKEQPFDPRHLPTDQEMLKQLKLKNYNTDFVRIMRPRESLDYPQGKLYIPRRNRHSSDSIRQMMRRYARLPYGSHFKIEMNRRLRRKFRRFISAYNLCPVRYTWRHIGPRFWPRWIKEGSCANLGSSCSLPAGMTCQEGTHENIGVLRYLCLEGWKPERCRWQKVLLGILKDCKCGCEKR